MSENFYTTSTSRARDLELDTRPVSVLAFGSQLFSGGVGLNASLPVYVEADIRCAGAPTLLLSNLPHYPSVQTLDVSADWMGRALNDLADTGALDELRAVAVGYLADPAQAYAIARWFEALPRSGRPLFVLDPTFGDGDVGFYTNPAVVPAIREALVPLANIMTPNAFELLHLTADRVDTRSSDRVGQDARAAEETADMEVARKELGTRGEGEGDTRVLASQSSHDASVSQAELDTLVVRARLLMTPNTRAVVLTGVRGTRASVESSRNVGSSVRLSLDGDAHGDMHSDTYSGTHGSDTHNGTHGDTEAPLIGNVIVSGAGVKSFFLPEVPTRTKGLGDTFTAALVANYLRLADLDAAVQTAAAYVQQAILNR
ncbi:bifunctional hydroxymethylpyrimidine kinase/phosphomethylpyrimidine kinase [Actinomycetaceae bacterium L2_0104]